MTLDQAENYSGFSLNDYEMYISTLKNRGLEFLNASGFLKAKSGVFWRHDIDYSIDASVTLSKIENALGINSTYYVDLNTYFYNALTLTNINKINFIHSLGHDIGIHFDARVLPHDSEAAFHDKLAIYKTTFVKHFGISPQSFTFHRPNQTTEKFTSLFYAGLINCYSPTFMAIGTYCSDSNGHWRHKTLREVILGNPPFHILTHPGWWMSNEKAPRNRIVDTILQEASKSQDTYDRDMLNDNRNNIGIYISSNQRQVESIEERFLIDCLISLCDEKRAAIIKRINSI